MNTHDLVAFVAVVETGSIVAASTRLNLTQPGVTRRIQNLEEMLGAQLLDRLSKPLRPTAAGREAYEQGRRLLRMLDDLKSGVANDGVVRGEFRLGLTPFLSEAGLSAPLDAVRAEFPALSVRVVSGRLTKSSGSAATSWMPPRSACLTGQRRLPISSPTISGRSRWCSSSRAT
jgi:DNA-binding transcriptional LysR family regulator